MSKFAYHGDEILARLDEFDVAMLSIVPSIVSGVGEVGVDPAAQRLLPTVHADDPERSAEFRRLSASLIDDGRRADLEVFEGSFARVAEGASLTAVEAESWIRVLESARLILGARLGVGESGWEERGSDERPDPRVIALYVIGLLQDSLLDALSEFL